MQQAAFEISYESQSERSSSELCPGLESLCNDDNQFQSRKRGKRSIDVPRIGVSSSSTLQRSPERICHGHNCWDLKTQFDILKIRHDMSDGKEVAMESSKILMLL